MSDIEHPAWAEVDRLRATTVDRSHFDRKIREWIALYDEEQAKRRAAERQLRGAVEDFKRVGKLAAWLIRDRREFDKVTAYAGELEALARRHGGSS